MKLEQAARQALEALKTSRGQWVHSVNAELCFKAIAILEEALDERPVSQEQNCCCEQGQVCGDCDPEAITALREALDPELQFVRDWNEGKVRRVSDGKVMGVAEQAEQEPVAWVEVERGIPMFMNFTEDYKPNINNGIAPLYAAPVRTKDLTDDEIYEAFYSCGFGATIAAGGRAVIAADREKNK